MTIHPFISIAVYFVVAAYIMTMAVKCSPDHDIHRLASFVAMTWRLWLVIAILVSPVIIGYCVGLKLRAKP